MSRTAGAVLWGAFALGVVIAPTNVAAAQGAAASTARGALIVEAPADCATRSAIAARVRQRSQRIEFAKDAPLVLRVAMHAEGNGGVSADLHIAWPDGHRSVRSLKAATCDAAVDALALLITLTLDPSARVDADRATGDVPEQAAGGSVDPSASGKPSEGGSGDSAAEDARAPTPDAAAANANANALTTPPAEGAPGARDPAASEPAASAPNDPSAASDQPDKPFGLSHVAVGVAAEAMVGPAPRVMPGIGASALVAWNGFGLWAPLLQLRVARTWLSTSEAGGVADFRLDAARLVACVVGLRSQTFAARACATGALGSLRASGSDTYDPESHAGLWASAGAEALLTANLIGPLQLQASAGVDFPLRRDRFAFAPEVFHRVAAACFQGQLGLALRFP